MKVSKFTKLAGAAMAAVAVLAGTAASQTWNCGLNPNNPNTYTASVKCTLDEDGTFSVSGEGAMANYDHNSLSSITPWVLSSSSIINVIIEDSVTSIGDQAFRSCNRLTSVRIGNDAASIGKGAFSGCSGLTSIYVEEGNANFSAVDGVVFNKTKTTLALYPYNRQGEYAIPNGVTAIGNNAFSGCYNLTSITIPDGVTTIGEQAFNGCFGLTEITIPGSVDTIGIGAFFLCNGLTSVTISNGVTHIDTIAFYGCSGLTSITIPASVTFIGVTAFSNCTGLTSVTSLNPKPPEIYLTDLLISAFYGVNVPAICLNVPEASVDDYKAADGWSDFGCFNDISVSVRQTLTDKAPANRPQVTLRGRTLNVRAPSSGAGRSPSFSVRLIDLRGKTAARFRVGESGAGAFSLAGVPAGRYLVEVKDAGRRVAAASVVVR